MLIAFLHGCCGLTSPDYDMHKRIGSYRPLNANVPRPMALASGSFIVTRVALTRVVLLMAQRRGEGVLATTSSLRESPRAAQA